MLYIACLEPRELTLDKKHCFVLGSYKTMLATWEKMEKPAAPAGFVLVDAPPVPSPAPGFVLVNAPASAPKAAPPAP